MNVCSKNVLKLFSETKADVCDGKIDAFYGLKQFSNFYCGKFGNLVVKHCKSLPYIFKEYLMNTVFLI